MVRFVQVPLNQSTRTTGYCAASVVFFFDSGALVNKDNDQTVKESLEKLNETKSAYCLLVRQLRKHISVFNCLYHTSMRVFFA